MKILKRIYLIGITISGVTWITGCTSNNMKSEELTKNSYEQITQEAAKEIMDTEDGYIILDVRTEDEYAGGHIKNAICIPNETIDETVTDSLPDKDQLIFVYCRSGNRSKQAAAKLADLGYTNIKEMGGINTWSYEIE